MDPVRSNRVGIYARHWEAIDRLILRPVTTAPCNSGFKYEHTHAQAAFNMNKYPPDERSDRLANLEGTWGLNPFTFYKPSFVQLLLTIF